MLNHNLGLMYNKFQVCSIILCDLGWLKLSKSMKIAKVNLFLGRFINSACPHFKFRVEEHIKKDSKSHIFKIKYYISYKDPIPDDLKSFLVYTSTCASCSSSCISETYCHVKTRIEKHIKKGDKPHICNTKYFHLLDVLLRRLCIIRSNILEKQKRIDAGL